MAFSSWRGIVGMINPTTRPGVTEEVRWRSGYLLAPCARERDITLDLQMERLVKQKRVCRRPK